MPGYLYLAIAIAAEVVATTSMKAIDGFTNPCRCCWWWAATASPSGC